MSLFDNARSVVLNDKVVKSIKTTDGGVIYEKTNDTYLTIDVPLSLIYSDAFNITGNLTDYNGDGLSGKSVDLLVGSTVVDSTTTITNGAYSFTSTPVRTGNHEFKVVFNGDSSYDSSESVTVSRVIGKETSVIVNNTDMSKIGFDYSNDYANKHIEFFLKTDDGEVIANASAKVDHMSVHTDNNGYCNGIFITDPSSTSITYAGDENYSPCSLTLQFVRQVPTVIQVTGDSVIQKEESTTLTVTVLDQDGDVIPNCTLSYSAKHGSTDVASGTLARTDSNGQATVSYTGTGIGDVDFTFTYNANGTLLQKTFVVEDCNYWNTAEVTRTSTNGSTIYDNNMSEALPTNCEISFDIWSNNSNTSGEHRFFLLPKSQYCNNTVQPQYALYVDQMGGDKGRLGQRNNNGTFDFIEKYSLTSSSYHTVKIIKTNDSLEFYVDDTLKTTQVLDWINNYTDYCFSMMRWTSSGTSKLKNIKIKTL